MYTKIRNQIGLSSVDNKRYIIPNTTNALVCGHRDIVQAHEPNENLDTLLESEIDNTPDIEHTEIFDRNLRCAGTKLMIYLFKLYVFGLNV